MHPVIITTKEVIQMMKTEEAQTGSYTLEDAATEFLREKGFRPDGRPVRCGVDRGQAAFERRLINTPTGRRTEWRRSK